MARTPRIDISTFAKRLAVVLKLLAISLFFATVSVADAPLQSSPKAVVVANPYAVNPQQTRSQPATQSLESEPNLPASVTDTSQRAGANSAILTNPFVTKPPALLLEMPSDWNPPVVENPFSSKARLSSQGESLEKRPLRWGPVSRWRSPNRTKPDLECTEDLQPLAEIPHLEPTGSAETDALSTAFSVEQRPENTNGQAGDGLPPDPTTWVTDEIQQPVWLQPGEMKGEAIVEESGRWHSPEEDPFDPFEEPQSEPETDAVFVSDTASPTRPQLPFRLPQIIAQTPDSALHQSSGFSKPSNALQNAQQQAQSAKSIADYSALIASCNTLLASRLGENDAVEARRLSAWAHNRIGELLVVDAQPVDALREFERSLQLDPTNSLALHNRAIHFAQQGEYEEALRDFSAAIEQNPGLMIAYRNRAELLSALGQPQAAIEDYTLAIKQKPDDEHLLVLRAHALHRVRDYSKAMTDFNAALRLVPTNPDAYTGRGNLHAEMGHYQSAIEDYRQALLSDPNWGDAYRSLAWLLATCPDPKYQNPRRAMIAARQAAKYGSENDPFVFEALAAASASAGQFRAAAELQQRALAVAPELVASRMEHRLTLYQQDQPFLSGQPSGVQQASYEE